MANMLAANGTKRKPKTVAMMPAVQRRKRKSVQMAPATKRRRKRKPGMLSAGGTLQTVLMQGALAIAGGMAGKVARNALPATMDPFLKAGIISGAGIAVAYFTKQPLLGAGMIGSAGAFAAANVGEKFNIPLLKESRNANFARLQENNRDQIFTDRSGQPLRKVGNQFFDAQGRLTPFQLSDFKLIN